MISYFKIEYTDTYWPKTIFAKYLFSPLLTYHCKDVNWYMAKNSLRI